MTEEQQDLHIEETEKLVTIAKAIENAAQMIYCHIIIDSKTKEIDEILNLDNKQTLWKNLQEFIQEHLQFINNISVITGITVQNVGQDYYNKITVDEIKNQLRILKGFVILKIILKSLYRKSFIECLKKLLQKTGLFSKAELAILFSIL